MGLQELPVEIVSAIFEVFCPHCQHVPVIADGHAWNADKQLISYHFKGSKVRAKRQEKKDSTRSLYSLCLVSRLFKDIATPFLYHEFTLGDYHTHESDLVMWRLCRFIWTISSRPHLAAHVRRIYELDITKEFVHDDGLTRQAIIDAVEAASRHFGTDVIAAIKAHSAHASTEYHKNMSLSVALDYKFVCNRLDKSIKRRDKNIRDLCSALFSIAIAILPGSCSVTIPLSPAFRRHYFRIVYDALQIPTLHVHHLNTSAIPDDFDLLTMMPDLQVLELREPMLWSDSDYKLLERDSRKSLCGSPNLHTLRMTESFVSEAWLASILEMCTGSLTTFAYEDCREWWAASSSLDGPPVQPYGKPTCDIIKCLEQKKTSLRNLWLDLRERDGKGYNAASLHDFEMLQDVFISIDSWYPWWNGTLEYTPLECLLPPSVERFSFASSLKQDWSLLVTELARLARLQRLDAVKPLPHLREVVCGVSLLEEDCEELSVTFSQAGIALTFREFGRSTPNINDYRTSQIDR